MVEDFISKNSEKLKEFDPDIEKIIDKEFKLTAEQRVKKIKGNIRNELVEKLKDSFGGERDKSELPKGLKRIK